MPRHRKRQFQGIAACGALLVLASTVAVAQDPLPPPKDETLIIRAVNGLFEVRGRSSPSEFVFTERCQASEPQVLLDVPLLIEATPNDSLELATKHLRNAVTEGLEVEAVPSSEAAQVVMFTGG